MSDSKYTLEDIIKLARNNPFQWRHDLPFLGREREKGTTPLEYLISLVLMNRKNNE